MTVIPSIHQCSTCSAVITFSSPHTTVVVCKCGTVVNRMSDGSIMPRPFHVITDKASIIAPGTTGQWDNKTFTVTGRFRTWSEESVVSYWTIIFGSGSPAYLVEGYGMYAILLPAQTPPELASEVIRNMSAGNYKVLDQHEYLLLRKDTCKKWDLEGELYIPECNSTFLTYDFSNARGKIMHIIEYWPGVQPTFEVHYTDFASMDLQNTRPYENPGKTFNCATCHEPVHVATFPYAQSCVCGKCGHRYVYENVLEFVKHSKRNTVPPRPDIQLGATGTLYGIPYKVLGYMLKEENSVYHSQWREYTLFNEQEGYAFLSEYDGHWIYLREQGKTPVPDDIGVQAFNYEGDAYKLFNSYTSLIVSALGEFPGNVINDTQISAKEYICPPHIWNLEQSRGEGIYWFKGKHLEATELKAAFGDAVTLPEQKGVGAVQPRGYISRRRLMMYSLIAIAVLIFIHLAMTATNRETELFNRDFEFTDSVHMQTTVIDDLHLDKRKSNVMLKLFSPVENSWMEVEATLVNKQTGTEYSVNEGVEFYSGYEDGEHWSEGGKSETVYINEVPRGDYSLKLEAVREAGFFPVKTYRIVAYYDVANNRNLFICIGLLLIWPIFKFVATQLTERKRWSNSPYSPYEVDSDE